MYKKTEEYIYCHIYILVLHTFLRGQKSLFGGRVNFSGLDQQCLGHFRITKS